MQKKQIDKIVETLLAGNKMLSVHCTACKSPLFEKGQKIFCPVCGEKNIRMESDAVKIVSHSEAERVLKEKLDAVATKIEKETDHKKTLELLEEMKAILEVLQKMK